MSDPLVSVVIPTCNSESTIVAAIQSVLDQDYEPLEVIVVDRGSTDKTAECVMQFQDRVRYIMRSHCTLAAALNCGIRAAGGSAIAFLDPKDRWLKNTLKSQVMELEGDAAPEIVQGLTQSLTSAGSEATDLSYTAHLSSLLLQNTVLEKVGLFNESLDYCTETEWLSRAWEQRIVQSRTDVCVLLHEEAANDNSQRLANFNLIKLYRSYVTRLSQMGQSSYPIDFPSLSDYISLPSRRKVTDNTTFSIISNDCWGWAAYNRCGLMYQTPFIGTRIFPNCYLKLLSNLRHYLACPLEFIQQSRYDRVNLELQERHFPIAVLDQEIEIHFYHEKSEQIAKNNWERRLARINWDNLFVKFSDYWDDDFAPCLEAFEALDFPYKVCFTSKDYPAFPSACFIPRHWEDAYKLLKISCDYFDLRSWLNQARGSETQAYRIHPPEQLLSSIAAS